MRERFLKRIALAVVFVFLTQTSLLAYQAPFFAPLPQLAPGVTAASVIITAPSVAYQSHLGVSSSQFRGDFGESLMRYFFTEGGDLSANKRWYSVDPGTVYAGKDGLILSAPDRPSRSGIDGLFMQYDAKGNPRGIMVVESKFGSSQLGMTRDGRQMSAYWIENCLRKTVEHLNRIKAGSKMISSATPPSPANASNTITISLGKGHTVKIWQDNRSKSYYFYSERPVTEKLIFKQMDKQAAFIKGVLDGKISMDSLLFNFDVNREGVLKLEIKKLSSSGGVVSVKSVDTISGKMFSQLSKQHQDIFRKSFVETIARSYQAQGYSADKAMEMAKNLMSQAEKKGDLSTVLGSYVNGTGDIERIGDHATNLMELYEYKSDNGVEFSPVAWEEFREMFDLVQSAVTLSLQSLDEEDAAKANEVDLIENEVDKKEKMLRKNHIARLNTGDCTPSAGVIFIDILSNLERICDHAHNLSFISLDITRLHM